MYLSEFFSLFMCLWLSGCVEDKGDETLDSELCPPNPEVTVAP